jgi:uncharacterized membrane protein
MATKKPNDKAKEIEAGKSMAILAYIIALIPYFAGDKENKFVRFHAVQGMNLLIIAVAYSVAASVINGIVWSATVGSCIGSWGATCGGGFGISSIVSAIIGLGSLTIGVIDIIGLVYAAQGEMKEVPLLGKFKFIKK